MFYLGNFSGKQVCRGDGKLAAVAKGHAKAKDKVADEKIQDTKWQGLGQQLGYPGFVNIQ